MNLLSLLFQSVYYRPFTKLLLESLRDDRLTKTCYVSHVMCHMSCVKCNFFEQRANYWRICYQCGLSRLVFTALAPRTIESICPDVRLLCVICLSSPLEIRGKTSYGKRVYNNITKTKEPFLEGCNHFECL